MKVSPIGQPSSAFEMDQNGYIIFPTDEMSTGELIDYLYDQVFDWFEGKFGVPLTPAQKIEIRQNYMPTGAKQAIMRHLDHYLESAGK